MKPLTLFLEPNYEKASDNIPERIKEFYPPETDPFFMQHQIDTFNANKEFDLVFNTYPTGTGKTRASLLYMLEKPDDNVLFIAPTNELISQHYEDIKKFVKTTGLAHNVFEINAKVIDNISQNSDLPRRSKVLFSVLANPTDERFIEKLNIDKTKIDFKSPNVLVTNPDIFYYALMFAYGDEDKRNIFHEFFTKFNYIVIDEFHYYNPKQLSCFLFFLSLSLKFGYFKNKKRKITMLTATPLPQIISYFEKLNEEGLSYTILKPEKVEKTFINAIRTLSPVKVTFYPVEDKFSSAIENNISFIKDQTIRSKDGAIISNSLININDTKNVLQRNGITDIGLITGVIDKEDRKKSQSSKLILATPTVDIGYNFEKNKTSQNIDYLIFDFKYEDQFWQRLGRAGRVLGKNMQDLQSEVLVFIDKEVFSKIDESFKDNDLISRENLKDITSLSFPVREDFYDYIKSYGISELSQPLENLRSILDKHEVVTEKLFKTLCRIFDIDKNYYYHVQSFFKRYKDLKIANGDITKCTNQIISEFSKLFKNDHYLMTRENLDNFIKEEYFFINGLYSFRESFQGINVLVYDPEAFMSFSSEKLFSYDLFHLLKNYELSFFSSKSEFIRKTNIKISENKGDFYCQVIGRLEEIHSISFTHKSEFEKDFFEERYLNKAISMNNIDFELNTNTSKGKTKKSKDLRLIKASEIFREKYIPCLIINNELKSVCIRKGIVPLDFNVFFSNGFSQKYSIVLGTNVYFLATKIKFISDYLDHKTKFYIC